ncbi:ATP-binding cassette domain-containing protein [Streptomyces sp. DSM 42041]|uniref:ATP-binding cassette domain-containing protein n=1 Tax=Streptomyces hazeniae TaxID=3075538 RepID=A0ABU2NQI3_9ACTN|nr:ATP-binding cassette domain-containing protein [Streptomyces sp. DSM 42041]MDT0379045.1 ATP-binding cassette domain-containing protein [Streptomyces sp. DSM 42041]
MTEPPGTEPPVPAPVLNATGLTRRYGSLTAVDDVSLRLTAGARHALIGPNGAGKTTLLGLVAGTERPDRGRIELNGTDVTRKRPARRSALGIGRSFQQPHAVDGATVLDNVVLALWRHHPQRSAAWRRPVRRRRLADAARAHLDAVGLAGTDRLPAGALSHGQRRLLDLACALAAQPRLLLLDEPAAGLTDEDIGRLLDVLGALPPDVAVLLVEHHTEVVARLTGTATVLASGREVVAGPTAEVLRHPEVRRVYLGTSPSEEDGEPGTRDDDAVRKDG